MLKKKFIQKLIRKCSLISMRKIFQNKGARGIMVQRIIKCGLVGGLILFVWGAVSWTILPWQKGQMKGFSDESEVRSAIMDNAKGSGLYVLPNLHKYAPNSEDLAAAKARMAEGPFVIAAVSVEGRNPSMAGSAVMSLILKIVAACLVTWLLLKTQHQAYPLDYHKSVKFVTVVGIVIALLATIPYGIWFAFPAHFVIGSIIEIVFGWFFAGLAISKLAMRR